MNLKIIDYKIVSLTICFLSLISVNMFSQISEGGIPPGIEFPYKTLGEMIDLPSIDNDSLRIVAAKNQKDGYKALEFAHNFKVGISPASHGTWKTLPDGRYYWSLVIQSKYAFSIGLYFSYFNLPEGAKIYFYNEDASHVLGAFSSSSNNKFNNFGTIPISGDKIYIDYTLPQGKKFNGEWILDMVAHDFTGAFKDGFFAKSGLCNVDINCTAGDLWQTTKRAVTRLVIYKGTKSELCTGAMINNTLQDAKPYILTANHCYSADSLAKTTSFIYQYESPFCKGPDGITDKWVFGGEMRATTSKLDFALLEMNQKPPFHYHAYYAGWNRNNLVATSVVAIHHPNGDVKKISKDDQAPMVATFGAGYDNLSHWVINRWELGVTEPGSSGSPLFDTNFRIVGDLSGGTATCSNPTKDYFARMSSSWTNYPDNKNQLKFWLDPLGTNPYLLDGFDPYLSFRNTCDTLVNFNVDEKVFEPIDSVNAWSGHNQDSILKFAEKFTFIDSTYLTGLFLDVAKNINIKSSYMNIEVYKGDALPDSLLHTQKISMSALRVDNVNDIVWMKIIPVIGNVFVSVSLIYDSSQRFALYHSPKYADISKNTAFIYSKDSIWKTMTDYNGAAFGLSFGIKPVFCNSLPMVNTPHISDESFVKVFPNPVSERLNIEFNSDNSTPEKIEIYNIAGTLVFSESILHNDNSIELDVRHIPHGLYFLKVIGKKYIHTEKLIIVR